MASEIDICNLALLQLGADPIISIENPTTVNEERCRVAYPSVRDTLLECGDWSFAMTRVTLSTPNATSPDWGYSHAFNLPSNTLRVIDARVAPHPNTPTIEEWRKEGLTLVANAEVLYIRTIRKETNPNYYSDTFIQAVAARLAQELCISVTANTKLYLNLTEIAEMKLSEAKINDGMQGTHEQVHANALINARRGGSLNGGGF